ncbi:AAA family ATPase [Leptolyngbya sp. AN03gr2]|uniref:AAA family ATPase n=1 Tax=unclassified Leptolyngbya TaxID=2650499 RepID=UPI003D31EF5B
MRIKALRLTNFRGFKDFHLEFPKSNIAVFIGENGSGKSSLLNSMSLCLNVFVNELTQQKTTKSLFTADDIHKAATNYTIALTIAQEAEAEELEISWKRPSHGNIFQSAHLLNALQSQLKDEPSSSIPVMADYPANRLIYNSDSKARLKSKNYDFSQFYAYQNAFHKELIHYEDFVTWFRLEEDLENEIISRENRNYVSSNLKTIRTALEIFLSQLNATHFSNLRVVRERQDANLGLRGSMSSSLEISKDGIALKIEQLSEGERAIVLIVCDIARRLTIANPALDDPKTGHGIVLIDEIDNHLHPQWQRQILPALTHTFPNCQFITTTHSPQVLSNLKPEEIFVLDNGKISNNIAYSYGRDSNSILYEFMGVEKRPEWMRQQLDRTFHLIDAGNIEGAKTAIAELQKSLGQNDPDIVKANTLLQFLYE